MFVNNLMIQESFEIWNVISEYFSTVGHRLSSNSHDDSDTTNPMHYLSYSSQHYSFFSEFDVENVHKIVAQLNNSRSTTFFDVFPISVYKENWMALGSVITKIYKPMFRTGHISKEVVN